MTISLASRRTSKSRDGDAGQGGRRRGSCACTGINNGVLMVRNSGWSRKFWGEVSGHATTEGLAAWKPEVPPSCADYAVGALGVEDQIKRSPVRDYTPASCLAVMHVF